MNFQSCFLTPVSGLLFLLALTSGCKNNSPASGSETKDFAVRNFVPVSNWEESKNEKTITMDYHDAYQNGFVIPSVRQLPNGYFIFRFQLKNKTSVEQKFFYKIYYQDESYKFSEMDSAAGKENELSEENFYGSWENTDVTFKNTNVISPDQQYHEITDSFRVVGNPRNEQRCFSNGRNNRWQRNPRVGTYSFMLVVTTEENIRQNSIPTYVQNIALKNENHFTSPYYFFLHGKGNGLAGCVAEVSATKLKLIAKPDLGTGICIDSSSFNTVENRKYFSSTCGTDSTLFNNAPFAQFINHIDPAMRFENIPLVLDVLKDNYSKLDYNWNRSFYSRDEMISTTPQVPEHPCETVFSDPVNKKIIIKNPGTEFGKWRKQSVGVITRHGLTYGKYRVKCKLTELLNANNVWNGLVNAIWLICQPGGSDWNNRRTCNKEGYLPNYWKPGKEDKRVPQTDYSEIDFEIVKTAPYCPENSFPVVYKNAAADQHHVNNWNVPLPDEMAEHDGDVSVTCTNWDMACWEPKNFGVGCNPIKYNNQVFEAHRWDHWYRAITEKTMASDDELFGSKYYYFEIEWKPTEIIWRIGREPDQMYVVSYMNNTITSVPDNQMCLIITQEYHNTKWWIGSPYQQQFIPFPKNDIIGEIYELVIE
ncbi:MAG: hypothetical protein NT126_02295 [Bacteroidetes bacterium]|nr:hypothetical protein [Bacteroidota bacterium]